MGGHMFVDLFLTPITNAAVAVKFNFNSATFRISSSVLTSDSNRRDVT